MKPELVLVAVTLLWGSTFIVTKDVVRAAPPLLYLAIRFGLAAVIVLALSARRARWSRPLLVDGAVLGVMNSLGLCAQVFGQAFTTATKSAFITSLNTPLVPVCAWLLYRTRPSRPQLVAVALATLGLLLLTYPQGGAHWNPGDLSTVACAVIYALTIIQIAKRSRHHDALPLTAVLLAASVLTFALALLVARAFIHAVPPAKLPSWALLEARPFVASPRLVAEILYLVVVCTVVTFIAQNWAMARMSAIHAAIVFALEPVFATLLALGWEGAAEWPGARGALGAAVVMLAVAVATRRAQSSPC